MKKFIIYKNSQILFLILLIISICSSLYAQKKIKITFINPNTNKNLFWNSVVNFMQATAKDLKIDLNVVYAGDRFGSLKLSKKILNSPKKPDYLVYIFQRGVTHEILKEAEMNKVKSFIFNTDVPKEEQHKTGRPGEKFKYWLGHMVPDDVQAGYNLAKILIKTTNKKKSRKNINMIALTGSRDSSAALDRNKGLKKALSEHSNTKLLTLEFTEWSKKRSYNNTRLMFSMYPSIDVIWCASDQMSLGVIRAIKEQNLKPGKDIFTGGIDWDKEGILSVKKGESVVSLGGHFMDGGWVLILLHDYFYRIDFTKNNRKFKSKMSAITRRNVKYYLQKFKSQNWKNINFKKFSKKYNKNLKNYDFSLKAILKQR